MEREEMWGKGDMGKEGVRREGNLWRELSFFLGHSMGSPKVTGAQIPTWRWLARAMTVNTDAGREGGIVELGAGTGAITRALFERGFTKDRVCTVELAPEFASYCRKSFPGLKVIEGSAFDVEKWRDEVPFDKVQAVVSSLPLAFFGEEECIGLLNLMLRGREEGGLGAESMYQMAYFGREVVKRDRGEREGIEVRMDSFVAVNIYPSAVWRYRLRAEGEVE